ncbi:hemin uptake protein HemP [Antarcticirhabdus aurantiaca]|uniref:Hemin uptake protein HemP n=1 Tax=Antarcticirhabdus aurantiaca TaxID=2606717 RepID=A0ACD4NQ94_9HYPH|nr:hemin uptake protein HemP [Antarcticirhabdus aurantiaca]WAJ28954.1 hemin uptake protein HemP [Jeongeuplla avenae]
MVEDARAPQPAGASSRPDEAVPVEARTLLGGRRELLIAHGAELYRLRLTSNNKLILTK